MRIKTNSPAEHQKTALKNPRDHEICCAFSFKHWNALHGKTQAIEACWSLSQKLPDSDSGARRWGNSWASLTAAADTAAHVAAHVMPSLACCAANALGTGADATEHWVQTGLVVGKGQAAPGEVVPGRVVPRQDESALVHVPMQRAVCTKTHCQKYFFSKFKQQDAHAKSCVVGSLHSVCKVRLKRRVATNNELLEWSVRGFASGGACGGAHRAPCKRES
eukprot:1141041-Pelagomonas_calceolata.AAC.7